MAGGYSVTITAVDQASKTIDGVNKRLQAIRAPTERLQASLTKFSRLSGLSDLATGMQGLGRNALDAFRSIGQILAPLGVITGAASLAGLARMTQQWAIWAQHLDIVATRIGITSTKLYEMESIARLTGVSAEAMDAGLMAARDTMVAISGGRASGEQIAMFHALGLSMDFARRASTDMAAAMPELMAAIRRHPDPTLRNLAESMFGIQGIAPVINKTAEEYARLAEEARKHGEPTQEQIDKLKELAAQYTGLQLSVDSLGTSISASVSGPMGKLLTFFTDLIDRNREVVAARIGAWAEQLDAWVEKQDWVAISHGFEDFANALLHVADEGKNVVGWLNGMNLLLPVVGGLLLMKVLGPLNLIGLKLAWFAGFKLPVWLGSLLGLSAETLGALAVPLTLKGDTPGGPSPDAISPEDAQKRVDALNAGSGYNGGFFHDVVTSIGRLFGGAGTQGGGSSRNLRDNNPTNLTFAGQPGAEKEGPFAKFPNIETGVAADLNQFLLYQGRGKTSIEDMIHTATPPGPDNPNVESYIDRVSAALKMPRNSSPNLKDPKLATRFIMAVSGQEGGVPNEGAVARGVNLRLGITDPAAPAAGGAPKVINSAPPGNAGDTPAPPNGTATITVRHENPPPGARVTATADGPLFNGAPRIETSMPVGGGP